MRVVIGKFAESDIIDAAEFYDQQELGLGDEVADFLHRELLTLDKLGGIHRCREDIYQMVIRGRFPYYVAYYLILNGEVHVIGVYDHRRNPVSIVQSIRDRL